MDKMHSTHAKSMATKIRQHAQAIVRRMEIIEELNLSNVPVETIVDKLKEATYYCDEINSVLNDMLPTLKDS